MTLFWRKSNQSKVRIFHKGSEVFFGEVKMTWRENGVEVIFFLHERFQKNEKKLKKESKKKKRKHPTKLIEQSPP